MDVLREDRRAFPRVVGQVILDEVDWAAGENPGPLTVAGKRLTWAQTVEYYRDEASRMGQWRTLLLDLVRSPHGRHHGDAEYQDPSGASQGNPYLMVGQRIGTTMDGRPIIVPPGESMHLPNAWLGDNQ